jgi:hypothetical protein
MSRVFEALRSAEREVHSETAPARDASNGQAAHPTDLGGEEGRDSEEPRKAFTSLQEKSNIMAAQFEDSRGYLETLIADARRVRDSLEAEVKKSPQIIHDCDLEALRAAGKRIQVELGKDLESLAQRIFEQAEKRLEEETATAFERLGQAVESRLASASTSAYGVLEGRINELAGRLREELLRAPGGFEEESSEKLRRRAESVTKVAAEAMRKQAVDALEMFNQGLVACSSRIVAETQSQLESAKGTLQSNIQEAEKTLEHHHAESTRLLRELGEKNAEEIRAALGKELATQRADALHQIQDETSELAREVVAQIGADVAKVSCEGCEAVQKHVDQAATMLKEWQDLARSTLEADLNRSLEAFEKHVADLSGALLAEHSRTMRLWVDDLHARMERATRVLSESGADPEAIKAAGEK